MSMIINIIIGTYTRRLLLQLAASIGLIALTVNLLQIHPLLSIIPFFLGGILTITGVLLIIEYVRHAYGTVTSGADGQQSDNMDIGDASVTYKGPSHGAIFGLVPVMFVSFIAVLIGVLVGLSQIFEVIVGGGAVDPKYDLEFKPFFGLKYALLSIII